jgi:hypothetical protein
MEIGDVLETLYFLPLKTAEIGNFKSVITNYVINYCMPLSILKIIRDVTYYSFKIEKFSLFS